MGYFRYVGDAALVALARAALLGTVTESLRDLKDQTYDNTPEDSGDLRDGLRVEGPGVTGGGVEGRVTTSGPSDAYAVFVHEGTSDTPAFKFMESVVVENADKYRAAMAAGLKSVF